MTKVCMKCGLEKPIDDFYKHSGMGSGYLGKCKECTKKDVSENYRKRRDYYAQYERERAQRPSRKDSALEYQRRRRALYPEKNYARQTVSNALRDGRLQKQPCEICGSLQVQAHHMDYSRPLEVTWLCRTHHLQMHDKESYEVLEMRAPKFQMSFDFPSPSIHDARV